MPTVKQLDQTHQDLDMAYNQGLWALYRGGQTWARSKANWFPRRFGESVEEHNTRLRSIVYENKAGPVVDTMGQWLTEEPLVVDDERVRKALTTAPGTPTLTGVVGEVVTQALVHRRGWVFVDLPPTEAQTLGEQESRGDLRPIYKILDSTNVIDWELDARGQVEWAIIREVVSAREQAGASRTWRIEWTYVSKTVIEKYRLTLDDDKDLRAAYTLNAESLRDREVRLVSSAPVEFCPLACLELSEGLWAMDRLADPALGHLRTAHSLDWALDRSAFSMMYAKVKDMDRFEGLQVGPGYMVMLGIDEEVGFVEPTGAAFDALRATKNDYEQAVYRTMRQMALATRTDAGAPASGAAKARDMDPLRIVLAALRSEVMAFAMRLVRLSGVVVGTSVPDTATLSGLDAWKERTLDEFFVAASLAVDAGTMSVTLARETAKTKARMLLAGTASAAKLPEIEAEIDQADPTMGLAIGAKPLGDDVAATLAGGTGGPPKDERAAEDKRAAQRKSGQGRRGAKGGGG